MNKNQIRHAYTESYIHTHTHTHTHTFSLVLMLIVDDSVGSKAE